jgi:hypothetical protein
MAHQLRFGLLLLPLFALGCPDSEARFDEFLDATKDERMEAADEDEDEDEDEDTAGTEDTIGTEESAGTEDTGMEGLTDMSGVYLLALETALGPDIPLQFVTTVEMTVADDAQSATASFTFQPLALEMFSLTAPRTFVGEPLTFEGIVYDADGNYELDMGLVMVTGAANPITGSDIAATLVIDGHIVHVDAMCGTITGELMSPLTYDLAGSTFAMTRLDDDGSDPATLPMMFPYRCNQVPAGPGDGDGDTGTDTDTDSGTDSGTDTGTDSTT